MILNFKVKTSILLPYEKRQETSEGRKAYDPSPVRERAQALRDSSCKKIKNNLNSSFNLTHALPRGIFI